MSVRTAAAGFPAIFLAAMLIPLALLDVDSFPVKQFTWLLMAVAGVLVVGLWVVEKRGHEVEPPGEMPLWSRGLVVGATVPAALYGLGLSAFGGDNDDVATAATVVAFLACGIYAVVAMVRAHRLLAASPSPAPPETP